MLSKLRRAVSVRLRELALNHYLVPYSRFGVESGLVPHLRSRVPITLIDIGANRGDFTDSILQYSGIKRALLVEPQAERVAELTRRFPDSRVAVAHSALLDRAGSADLNVLGSDACSSLLPVTAGEMFSEMKIDSTVKQQVQVPVNTLDGLLAEQRWSEPIDLLKLDTQGTELLILRGAEKVLPTVRLLWIEVSFKSMYQGDAQFHQVHDYLSERNFRLFSLHPGFRSADGTLVQADALFLGPTVSWHHQ